VNEREWLTYYRGTQRKISSTIDHGEICGCVRPRTVSSSGASHHVYPMAFRSYVACISSVSGRNKRKSFFNRLIMLKDPLCVSPAFDGIEASGYPSCTLLCVVSMVCEMLTEMMMMMIPSHIKRLSIHWPVARPRTLHTRLSIGNQ
jgi:hypothetical protein